jgi:hypothetical protein
VAHWRILEKSKFRLSNRYGWLAAMWVKSNGSSVLHQYGLSAFEIQLDVSHLSPGIYLIRMKMTGETPVGSKLIVQ